MGAEQQSNFAAVEPVLHQAVQDGVQGEELSDGLTGILDVLEDNKSLLQALTNPGRSPADKQALARGVFADHVGSLEMQLLELLAGMHWSKPHELNETVRDLSLDASVLASDFEKKPDLSQQLIAVCEVLRSNSDLRLQLSDLGNGTPEERADLAERVFASHVSSIALKLIRRAARDVRYGHIVEFLTDAARRAARLNGELLVVCTSARPLTSGQATRIKALAEEKWRQPVDLAQLVDPRLVGGFRLVAGYEAIDTSVRSDIYRAKLALMR